MSAYPETILKMFRLGNDTYDIAKKLNWSEAKVSRLLWIERCREMGLPATEYRRGRPQQAA